MNQTSRLNFSSLLVAIATASLITAQVGCDPEQLSDRASGNPQQPATERYPNALPPQPNDTTQPYYPKANARTGLPANNVRELANHHRLFQHPDVWQNKNDQASSRCRLS